jgi:hypothetical protein
MKPPFLLKPVFRHRIGVGLVKAWPGAPRASFAQSNLTLSWRSSGAKRIKPTEHLLAGSTPFTVLGTASGPPHPPRWRGGARLTDAVLPFLCRILNAVHRLSRCSNGAVRAMNDNKLKSRKCALILIDVDLPSSGSMTVGAMIWAIWFWRRGNPQQCP